MCVSKSMISFLPIHAIYLGRNSLIGMDAVRQYVFRTPDGRKKSFPSLLLSAFSLLAWGYFAIGHDGSHTLLFMSIGFGLAGLAESLPPSQRRSAGILRIVAVSTMILLLCLLAASPELILG